MEFSDGVQPHDLLFPIPSEQFPNFDSGFRWRFVHAPYARESQQDLSRLSLARNASEVESQFRSQAVCGGRHRGCGFLLLFVLRGFRGE
jgi:hypothetical protein